MTDRLLIDEILACKTFAVTGVSRDKEKYGYKVYDSLVRRGYTVFPVNPNADMIDGATCYPSLSNVPAQIDCLVCVTPPEITSETLHEASGMHIKYLWMQPGAGGAAEYNLAESDGMRVVWDGACIMVAAAQRDVRRAQDQAT